MISGHFATALVAKTQAPKGSIWLYLIAAQFLDILMISAVLIGFDKIDLGEGILPSMGSAMTDMRHTHDIIPVAGWTITMGLIGYVVSRQWVVAAWCAGLSVIHELCDLVSGYPHNIWGPETAEIGMKLWVTAPVTATFIESGLGIACVYWFLRHYNLEKRESLTLYIVLGATPFLLLPLVLR